MTSNESRWLAEELGSRDVIVSRARARCLWSKGRVQGVLRFNPVESSLQRSQRKSASFEMIERGTLMSRCPKVMGSWSDYEIANSKSRVLREQWHCRQPTNSHMKDLKQIDYFSLQSIPKERKSCKSLTSSGLQSRQAVAATGARRQHECVPRRARCRYCGGGDLGKSIPAMNALVSAGQTAWNPFATQIKTFCPRTALPVSSIWMGAHCDDRRPDQEFRHAHSDDQEQETPASSSAGRCQRRSDSRYRRTRRRGPHYRRGSDLPA